MKRASKKVGAKSVWWHFFVVFGLVISFFISIAGACDKKKKNGDDHDPGDPPRYPNPTFSTSFGFVVELANDQFENAFTFDDFAKDGATGSFNAKLTVNVSQLTWDNGFVSNHVWIHPDKTKANVPFEDRGTYVPVMGAGEAEWKNGVASQKNAGAKDFDGIFCGMGKAVKGGYISAVPNPPRGAVSGRYNPDRYANPANSFLSEIVNDNVSDSRALKICSDTILFGGVVSQDGSARVGINAYQGVIGVGNPSFYVDKNYEPKVAETGAYYLRDNAGYDYHHSTKDYAGRSVLIAKPIVHDNDTDVFYDEVLAVFVDAGVAMADLVDVFPVDENVGIKKKFTNQPKGTGATGNTSFAFDSSVQSGGNNKQLGTDANGGWQKVFTIKSYDKKMENGFAMVYNLGSSDDEVNRWKREPDISYDATAHAKVFPKDAAEKVVWRKGSKKANKGGVGNAHAILMESIISPEYNGNNHIGFFAVQHGDLREMSDTKNAFATKGVLMCRSALALNGNDGEAHAQGLMNDVGTQVAELKKYNNTLQGYFDGEISEDTKGLGMTCYLGLSALWPEAIDGSKVENIHNKQFEFRTKDNCYDVSDKHLGVVMVKVSEDVTINDDLLKPIFINRMADGANNRGLLSKSQGKAALQAIKNAADKKVSYKHGVVTVRFAKDSPDEKKL